jgi:hypothetical protein
MQSKR